MRVNLSVAFILSTAAFAQPQPQDVVHGLVRAFDHHSVVIVGEQHWLAETCDLYIALVRDPEFQAKVSDIVIEFGSRQNQPVLDRYISGEVVPFAELAHVWRDTTKVASHTTRPPISQGPRLSTIS
ncbi:MAG TPA: hypothetical protein VGZ73_28040 [Bryobacteraceae bacterium]|jgi:hypothetical protein|nr:hypothetical protein [Bryobacteraceae bacterium]